MIVREYYDTRIDGIKLYRTYSDTNMMIRQDATGAEYSEAVDVETSTQTYTETDIPIEASEPSDSTGPYLPAQQALDIVFGEVGT